MINCSKILHTAATKAYLDEDAYRALLMGAAGVYSSKDIKTAKQYAAVRKAFKNLGVSIPYIQENKSPEDKQMGKAFAIWSNLFRLGKVSDGSWKAMMSFVKRQFSGQDILTSAQKSHLIEMLKSWESRGANGNS